jgi:hypothetical protein
MAFYGIKVEYHHGEYMFKCLYSEIKPIFFIISTAKFLSIFVYFFFLKFPLSHKDNRMISKAKKNKKRGKLPSVVIYLPIAILFFFHSKKSLGHIFISSSGPSNSHQQIVFVLESINRTQTHSLKPSHDLNLSLFSSSFSSHMRDNNKDNNDEHP